MIWLLGCGDPAPVSSDSCGTCHAEVHGAWSGSAHAAGTSEVFDAWLPRVRTAWGEPAAARCEGCHEPELVPGETVGCLVCHAAVGNRAPADGALVVDLGAPISGRGTGAPHEVVHRPFASSSELCATCHEVTGPGLLVEQTGTEHAASGSGRTCADCHLAGHAFVVEPLFADAIELRVVDAGPGALRIEVENVDAGHAVPTGAAFLRDLHVDLVADGEVVVRRALEIGPRPSRAGRPVALLTDGDGMVGAALQVGETRAIVVALPPGVAPAVVEAELWFARYRPEVLDALQIVGPEATRVATARLPAAR